MYIYLLTILSGYTSICIMYIDIIYIIVDAQTDIESEYERGFPACYDLGPSRA
jgi:hypothetical protein